jgi:hypothetical protein
VSDEDREGLPLLVAAAALSAAMSMPARVQAQNDDANGGWKGRGVWTTSGDRATWLKEGGKGTVPIAFHFQFRPDPLAD